MGRGLLVASFCVCVCVLACHRYTFHCLRVWGDCKCMQWHSQLDNPGLGGFCTNNLQVLPKYAYFCEFVSRWEAFRCFCDLPGLWSPHLWRCPLQFGDELSLNFPPPLQGILSILSVAITSLALAQCLEWHRRLSPQAGCLQFNFCFAEFAPRGLHFSRFKP